MNPVDPCTLKPGQRVRITTRTVEGLVGPMDDDGLTVHLGNGSDCGLLFDEIETIQLLAPPLPTEVGKRIVAMAPDYTSGPVVLTLTALSTGIGWLSVDGHRISPKRITEWALLDGVHTVHDPEPPCLFADEHQRWASIEEATPGDFASQDGIHGTLVECSRCGPGHLLLDPDEEQYGTEPTREDHRNEFGEPTTHVVVETWNDVPKSIRDHCLQGIMPGVYRHVRLGIYLVILSEVRKAVVAAGVRP